MNNRYLVDIFNFYKNKIAFRKNKYKFPKKEDAYVVMSFKHFESAIVIAKSKNLDATQYINEKYLYPVMKDQGFPVYENHGRLFFDKRYGRIIREEGGKMIHEFYEIKKPVLFTR